MLDVHPPHETIHTWKSFLIHIATIVIGLLIAIGLEQAVEAVHHRHLAHAARERLLEEVRANGETAQSNAYAIHAHERHLRDALQVLGRARAHSLLPTDHIISMRPWKPVEVAAWKIARDNGAAGYLSASEQAVFELANWDAGLFNEHSTAAMVAIGRAAILVDVDILDRNSALPRPDPDASFGRKGDAAAEAALLLRSAGVEQISRLTASQLDSLEQSILSAIYDDEVLLNDCRHLTRQAEDIPRLVRAE